MKKKNILNQLIGALERCKYEMSSKEEQWFNDLDTHFRNRKVLTPRQVEVLVNIGEKIIGRRKNNSEVKSLISRLEKFLAAEKKSNSEVNTKTLS